MRDLQVPGGWLSGLPSYKQAAVMYGPGLLSFNVAPLALHHCSTLWRDITGCSHEPLRSSADLPPFVKLVYAMFR